MSDAIRLEGDAYGRGRGQAAAAPDMAGTVQAAIERRLAANADLTGNASYRDYLERTANYLAEHDPEGSAEMAGIADGFAVPQPDLFAFLHMAVLRDMADSEGCSAFAYSDPQLGAVVGKNRDLSGPQLPLQRVFHHVDPAWGGRQCLFVGSLGAPGAYSSGVNSDGLALVDTQIATRDHGVGLLRYFVMTRLLVRCATVADALAEIGRLVHAGGGSLVLADSTGAVAAVELGHTRHAVEHKVAGSVAHTNHFVQPTMLAANLHGEGGDADNSVGRLLRLKAWLAGPLGRSLKAARGELGSHDSAERTGLCRHGGDDGPNTVSGALFTTTPPTLYFCHGSPCTAEWRNYRFA